MRKMSEQLLKEGEAVIAHKAELAKEQAAAKSLRDKLSKVGVYLLLLLLLLLCVTWVRLNGFWMSDCVRNYACGLLCCADLQAVAGSSSSGAQQEQLQQQVTGLNKRITALQHENEHLQSEVSRLEAFSAALQASAADAVVAAKQGAAAAAKGHLADPHSGSGAAAARRSGLTPLKPAGSRLANTLKSTGSVGMPDTPTDTAAPPGPGSSRQVRGRAGRGFSRDGGGSMAGTPGDTKSGPAGRLPADAAADGGSGSARQSDDGEVAEATGGVSYAPQHWEEVKLLQGRVDALRCVWRRF